SARPKMGAVLLGWLLLAWAALRAPGGTDVFLGLLGAFLLVHAFVPAFRRLCQAPRQPASSPAGKGGSSAAPAVAAWLLMGFVWVANSNAVEPRSALPTIAESVSQDVRIEENFALATAKIRWQAIRGQRLPLLFAPAVLTHVEYPAGALKLVEAPPPSAVPNQPAQAAETEAVEYLVAQKSGLAEITVQYQVQVSKKGSASGLVLPVQYGLINHVQLTIINLDVEVLSPQAVSIERAAAGSNTLATLVLTPATATWVEWKPRSRDVKNENPVFYAELSQLYVPAPGVIEGAHYVSIRPAQGELDRLVLDV